MSNLLRINDLETRQRITAFDITIEKTNIALSNPDIQRQLGARAEVLRQINLNAYLPNVRDGIIHIPKHEQDTDNVALFPALETDIKKGLGKHGDFALPSTERKLSIIQALGTAEWTPRKIDQEMDALLQEVTQDTHGTDVTSFMDKESVDGFHALAGHSYVSGKPFKGIRAFYVSRSLIVMNAIVATGSIGHVAATTAHEYSHAEYAKRLKKREKQATSAQDEMIAYNVSTIIGDTYKLHLSPREQASFEATEMFENARLEHTTLDAPFTPTGELIQFYIDHNVLHPNEEKAA